jgi:hypothetical protein
MERPWRYLTDFHAVRDIPFDGSDRVSPWLLSPDYHAVIVEARAERACGIITA